MTKIISDKATRGQAIPFIAEPFDGSDGVTGLDRDKIISSDLIVPIRCCTPHNSNLIEAHLNLIITAGSALTVKVAIGRFESDDFTAVDSYTEGEINAGHRQLTGTDTAIASSAGTLLVDGLNLLKGIPKRGDTNFSEDGFVVVLQFSRARTGSDELLKFEPLCSALMGLI